MANVVVLIPPPVDPGEAPMNIRMMKKVNVTLEKAEMFNVLNPAVRVVMD